MIIVKVGESEKLRFDPHQVGEDFIITPRRGRRFPIPIGSNVYDEDELLGVVVFMVPEQFQRCRIVFEPPVAELPQEEWEADHGSPLPGDTVWPDEGGDVSEEGSIEELELSNRLLDILGSHGLGSLLALRSALAQGAEFMLSLSGIGPKSLVQIERALGQLEEAKTPTASPDG